MKRRTRNDLRRYELESTGIVNAIKPNWCEAVESAAEVWFLQMHEAALQILLGIFCQHGGDECKYYGGSGTPRFCINKSEAEWLKQF